MKLYSWFLLLLPVSAEIYSQETAQELLSNDYAHETFLNKPFTLEFDETDIDADDQIAPQALSEEDISFLIFDETELQHHNLQEDFADKQTSVIILPKQTITPEPINAILIIESVAPEKIDPAFSFLQELESFISEKNMLTKETLSSVKKAKLQGKLIAEYIKQLTSSCNISIAQAKDLAHNVIQKKCQDLHLGILNVEKKSLKKLLQAI